MCIYRAVDRKTHKFEKSDLCTERVSALQTLVLTRHALIAKNCYPIGYLHSEQGPAPTLHTEFGWYIWNDLLWRQLEKV